MGPPALIDEAQSYTAAYYGHLARARDLEQRAISSTKEAGAGETTTQYRVHAALLEALFGNFPAAQKILKDAGDFMINRDLEGEVATIGALSGDRAQAQKLTNDVSQRFPEYTYARFGFVPAIRGILAVQRGNLQQGIEDLRAISSRELMAPDDQTLYPMLPVYISGEAYLAAHQGAEAVAEFQMIIEHSSFVWNGPIGALAHLGLGRAWSLAGDKTRARAAYRDFLTLWKDADPDVPVLKEAKAEYARLQ
jgi:tetratricopeptide (TPR) repeat protein